MTAQPGEQMRPEPQFVERGAFLVAGIYVRETGQPGEIAQVWDQRFLPRLGELGIDFTKGAVLYGVIRPVKDGKPGEFEYLAAAEVSSLDSLPVGMTGWEVPARTYAVFVANDVGDLDPTFEYYHNVWLPRSDFLGVDEGPWLEVYPEDFGQTKLIHVYCPVRPRPS